MTEETAQAKGPDLGDGVAISTLIEGKMLVGHVQGEPVLLVRRAGEVFAIGATCTHYGAPLADGLLVGDTVLSVASRLFQPAHGGGRPRARIESGRMLARRAAQR